MSIPIQSSEIPLTIQDQQQNLRLLELTPELVDLLSVPKPSSLYFKSCPPGGSGRGSLTSTSSNPAAEHLHLCTGTQAYQVRQVSTSNSVYVIEPSGWRCVTSDGDGGMELDGTLAQPSSAMTAIAKVDTILELLPVSHDLKPMLEQRLPIYDGREVLSAEESCRCFRSQSTPASKIALFSDLPAPDSQAEQAWRNLLAFEFDGRCARPSAPTSLSVWQSIINHVSLERLDLSSDVNLEGFFQTEQLSPVYAPAAEAILSYLADVGVAKATSQSVQLDRSRTVRWTGMTLLQARSERLAPGPMLPKEDYMAQWQDLLPEEWRQDPALDKLPGSSYMLVAVDGRDTITWSGMDDFPASAQPAALEAASGTASKRKWHEKFKSQRKEVRR